MCFVVGNITICGFRKTFQILFYMEKRGETDYTRFIEKGLTLFSSIKIIFTKIIEYLKHYSWNTGSETDIKKNAFVYYSINSRRPYC